MDMVGVVAATKLHYRRRLPDHCKVDELYQSATLKEEARGNDMKDGSTVIDVVLSTSDDRGTLS